MWGFCFNRGDGIAGLAFLVGAACTVNRSDDNPARLEALAQPLEIVTELHCAEDADIVITLGSNGLPYAFCEQVLER